MPRKSRLKTDVFKLINIQVCDGKPDRDRCWLWKEDAPVAGRDSRPTYTYGGRRYLAYRVVYELHTGEVLGPDEVVRHRCDNKQCCNPYHLEKGSHQQNMDDMKERERHGLTHHAVRAIKRLLVAGKTHAEIAENFGVSRQTITAINNGSVYSHVSIDEDDNNSVPDREDRT